MEEDQPFPRHFHRTMNKPPFPPEATPSRRRCAYPTEFGTSSISSNLPE